MDSRFTNIGRNITTPVENRRQISPDRPINLMHGNDQHQFKNKLHNEFITGFMEHNKKPKNTLLDNQKQKLKERHGINDLGIGGGSGQFNYRSNPHLSLNNSQDVTEDYKQYQQMQNQSYDESNTRSRPNMRDEEIQIRILKDEQVQIPSEHNNKEINYQQNNSNQNSGKSTKNVQFYNHQSNINPSVGKSDKVQSLGPNQNSYGITGNIGNERKAIDKDSYARELKRQMDEAQRKKNAEKELLKREDEKLLKQYETLPDPKNNRTSVKIVSRSNSPEQQRHHTEPKEYQSIHHTNKNIRNEDITASSQINFGAESAKLAQQRNNQADDQKEYLKQQVAEKKRKDDEQKALEAERDRIDEERLQRQIQAELEQKNDGKKKKRDPNSNYNFVDTTPDPVVPKKEVEPEVTYKTKDSFHKQQPLNSTHQQLEEMQQLQALQNQQMMQQMTQFQNNPNQGQFKELEFLQKELRKQREDMEDTVRALKQQTQDMQLDSNKYQSEMATLKMQIDMSRDRESLVKQMQDTNINSLRQEIDAQKEKLTMLQNDSEKRKQNSHLNIGMVPQKQMHPHPQPQAQVPAHLKIVTDNSNLDELPTQSKLVEIPHMDKSFMIQRQKKMEIDQKRVKKETLPTRNITSIPTQQDNDEMRDDVTLKGFSKKVPIGRDDFSDYNSRQTTLYQPKTQAQEQPSDTARINKKIDSLNTAQPYKRKKDDQIDEKELKQLDDQPGSEQFDQSIVESPKKSLRKDNPNLNSQNLKKLPSKPDKPLKKKSVMSNPNLKDSFSEKSKSPEPRIAADPRLKNRNEGPKPVVDNSKRDIDDISNPNLLDSDED